jgi:hypothetical protein
MMETVHDLAWLVLTAGASWGFFFLLAARPRRIKEAPPLYWLVVVLVVIAILLLKFWLGVPLFFRDHDYD